MADLTEKTRELIDQPNVAYLATIDPDGSPQVTPVWIDREDGQLLVNTAVGRIKDRNMREDPRVAVSVVDRENPYEKVDIRGRVVDVVEGEEAESTSTEWPRSTWGKTGIPSSGPTSGGSSSGSLPSGSTTGG